MKKEKKPDSCPRKIFGDPANYQEQYSYYSLDFFPGWRNGSKDKQNNTHYTGWYGPTDASEMDFSNTNIGSKNNQENYVHQKHSIKNQ